MKPRPFAFVAALVLIAVALWLGLRNRNPVPPTAGGVPQASRSERPAPRRTDGESRPAATATAFTGFAPLFTQALAALRLRDAGETDRTLARLDEAFTAGGRDPGATIEAIVAFLRTGQDAPTGKGFVVAEGGVLAEATTLRVYLLDWLGRLSRESGDPAVALQMSREILGSFRSADEWAVSLRNVAWLDPASRGYLGERVAAMLAHPVWLDKPTAGMLEAFDIVVHAEALATVPALAEFITTRKSPPLARASGVALDRLASQSPLTLTALLNRQPELLATVPLARAGLMAHADPGNPAQRQQLETYLLRPDVDAREREKFFASLIQTGRFVSHNLVTPYTPPETPAEARVRLETLAATLNGWLRDPRLSTLDGELTGLGETVNQIVQEIAADN